MPTGRPTKYTQKLANEICKRMASGESVNAICKDASMPARSTVMLWVSTDRQGFSDKYAKAMEARAYHWADELVDIADHEAGKPVIDDDGNPVMVGGKPLMVIDASSVNHARLRVDTRKWIMSKLLPKYSDKPDSTPGDDLARALTDLVERLPE